MSNLSPFLQTLKENLGESGATDQETNVVVEAAGTDVNVRREACKDMEGFVWDDELQDCIPETDVEVKPTIAIEEIEEDDPLQEHPAIEEDAEVITEEQLDVIKKEKIDEGWVEADLKDDFDEIRAQEWEDYKKMAVDFDAMETFFMSEEEIFNKERHEYIDEMELVETLMRKYGGLGVEITEEGTGTNKIKIGDTEVSLGGMWTSLWNPKLNMSTEDKVETINNIVQLIVDQKQTEFIQGGQFLELLPNPAYDENFDLEAYANAYKHAMISNGGNSSSAFKNDSLEGIEINKTISLQRAVAEYFESEPGVIVRAEIEAQKTIQEWPIMIEAAKKHLNGDFKNPGEWREWIDEEWSKACHDIMINHPVFKKILYSSAIANDAFYSRELANKTIQENLEEQYGIIANSKTLTAFVKGFHITLPKEMRMYRAAVTNTKLGNLNKQLETLDEMVEKLNILDDEIVNLSELPNEGRDIGEALFSIGATQETIGGAGNYPYRTLIWNDQPQWQTLNTELERMETYWKKPNGEWKGSAAPKYLRELQNLAISFKIEGTEGMVANNTDTKQRKRWEEIFEKNVPKGGDKIKWLEEYVRNSVDGNEPIIWHKGNNEGKNFRNGFKIPLEGSYRMAKDWQWGNIDANELTLKEVKQYAAQLQLWHYLNQQKETTKFINLHLKDSKLTRPDSEFYKDGKFTINSKNYWSALGDQGMRMVASIFTGGMGSFVMETAGIAEQTMLEAARDKFPHWDDFDDEEQVQHLLDLLPTIDFGDSFFGGGINGALDMVSNMVFIAMPGPAKKLLTTNIKELWEFFTKQQVKQGLKTMLHAGQGLGISSITESVTEGLQEFNTTLATLGYEWDDFNWEESKDPIFNAMATALTTTPVLGGGVGVTKAAYRTAWVNRLRKLKGPKSILGQCKTERENASNLFRQGEITEQEYEAELVFITAAEQMFTPMDMNMEDQDSIDKLFDAALRQVQAQDKLKLLTEETKKLKKEYGEDYVNQFFDQNEADRLILEGNIKDAIREKINAKHFDYYKTQGVDKAAEINRDFGNIFNAVIYENDGDGNKKLLQNIKSLPYSNHPDIQKQIKAIEDGSANAFVLTPEDIVKYGGPAGSKGMVIASNENIENNINKGDRYASNAIHHEFEHILFYLRYKGEGGLKTLTEFRNKLNNTLANSKNPALQKIHAALLERMETYKAEGIDLNSRVGIEEYLAAFGDISKNLMIYHDTVGAGFHKDFSKIADEFRQLIHGNEGKVGDWSTLNTLEFLSGFKHSDIKLDYSATSTIVMEMIDGQPRISFRNIFSDDLIDNARNLPDNSYSDVKNSLVDVNDYNMIRQAVKQYYPSKKNADGSTSPRTNIDIAEENKRLAEKILEVEEFKLDNKDGRYSDEQVEQITNSVKESAKLHRDKLLWNNWAAFEKLINDNWRKGEGLDLIPGNFDQFRGKALEEFIKATQTYDPSKKTDEYDHMSFYAYYFGTGVAQVRLAAIYDGLNKMFTQPIDPTPGTDGMTTSELATYQENEIDAGTVINDFMERSALRESASKVIEFEVDGPNYNSFINTVNQALEGYNFADVFNPEASQDLRNMGMGVWKDLKKLTQQGGKLYKKGKPTQLYIDFINETVDTFYTQMSVRDLRKFLGDDASIFIEEIKGRANVDDYLEAKGRDKPKSKTAGNQITTKRELTPELKDILLERILRTEEIRQLEAQGLSTAEIHKTVRMDMKIEAVLKNYSNILFNDALMQVTTDKKFKEENGVASSQIAQLGLLIDKGIDVKFQLADKEVTIYAEDIQNTQEYLQKIGKLMTHAEEFNEVQDEDWEVVVGEIYKKGQELGLDDGTMDFVAALFDKGYVMDAEGSQFQTRINQSTVIDEKIKTTRNSIKNNVEAKKAVYENAVVMTEIFGKKFMETVGYEFLGFKNSSRVLQVGKEGSEFADRFTKMSTEIKESDMVKRYVKRGMSKERAKAKAKELTQALKDFRPMNILTGSKQNYTHTPKDKNIFLRLKEILEQEISRDDKLRLIKESGLDVEIEKANVANITIFKHVVEEFKQEALDGNIDENAMLEMFKMSSGTVMGFRSFSMLLGFQCIDGKQVVNKGEHLASISYINSEIVELIYRYKKDRSIDFDGELGVILSEYGQILGDEKHFEPLDKFKRTNVTNTYRMNLINAKGYTNANGDNIKVIQATTLADKDIKEKVVRRKKQGKVLNELRNSIAEGKDKGGSIVDFDATIAFSQNYVYAKAEGKRTQKILANEFVEKAAALEKQGYKFDFSDFKNVKRGKKAGFFDKFVELGEKFGTKVTTTDIKEKHLQGALEEGKEYIQVSESTVILTARQPEAAQAIQYYLLTQGVYVPLKNIVGLGKDPKVRILPKDKANWIEENMIWEGFNDILFADDDAKNVIAVKEMLETYSEVINRSKTIVVEEDPNIKYSLAEDHEQKDQNFIAVNPDGTIDLKTSFNNIVELESGVKAYATFDEAHAKLKGKGLRRIGDVIMPASMYDFEMFIYRYLSKGEAGMKQKKFFEEKLFLPFAEANNKMNKEIVRVKREKKKLWKDNKEVVGKLKEIIIDEKLFPLDNKGKPTTNFNNEHAIRVYLWTENGIKIPGMSPEIQEKLHLYVKNDSSLRNFANELGATTMHRDGYVKPSAYWHMESIHHDLQNLTRGVNRSGFLTDWINNKNEIFSEKNLLQLREAYGNKHVEALQDMLYRMEYGQRKAKKSRMEQEWDNWVNNSVGSIMFLNTKSALLQTISAANYLNWGDNNIVAASARIADIKQFSKDFAMIWSSDMLLTRRDGEQRGVNEAELARAVQEGKSPQAIVSWLLQKGFLPTQLADSFAISLGGASFYRNRTNSYIKDGMSKKDAEARAWVDFQELTQKTQQSSREDLISAQQAGGLGRIILAFKNTPMQYNRMIFKAGSDLYNMRVNNPKEFMSKVGQIAYYAGVQNAMFTFLQRALWKDFEDEGEEWDEKLVDGMVENILGGFGLGGQLTSQIIKSYRTYREEKAKGYNADHAKTIIDFASISPTIGSKLRDLYSGIQAEKFNQDVINDMGFDINNPAMNAIGNLLSATLNLPVDEMVQKTQNIMMVVNANRKPVGETTTITIIDTDQKSKTFGEEIEIEVEGKDLNAEGCEIEVKDQIALLLGYNPWELGLETPSRKRREELKEEKKKEKVNQEQEAINEEVEEEKKENKDVNTCAARTSGGDRCKNPVDKAGGFCANHMSKKEKEKAKKCSYMKPNGEQCKLLAVTNAGRCNTKQHQPGYKK